MFLVGLFFVFFSSSVKELRSKSTSTQTCLPAFLPSCPSVIVSAHSQFEVDAGSHHHFYTHCLWLYTFFFSLHLFFFFLLSLCDYTLSHAYVCMHTQTQRRPVPRSGPEGYIHTTMYVRFLQLDFLFSYTLRLSDNLWWPC